jgi:MFS family permease
MTPGVTGPGDTAPVQPPHRRARAVAGFVIGLALFGAAIWVIVSGEQDFAESWDAATHAPWWVVAAVLVLPVANWLTVSESFRALTNRYATEGRRPVGRAEMAGLIGSAWLLNYLPMKPGMFGRLAYHKHVNKIRYADSARVIGFSVSLTGFSLVLLVLVAMLVRTGGPAWVWCATPAAALGVGAIAVRGRGPWAGRVVYAAFWRYLDSMIWVGRYAASFALVGEPLSFADSVAVAAVSQVALLVPLSGNGLGVREWGVRLVTSPAGLLADVVNRAAEMAVALPIGFIGSAWSVRRVRAARTKGVAEDSPHASATAGSSE